MNFKTALMFAGVAAVASQAAMTLWSMDVPDKQVQVPCVVNGTPSGDVNNDGETNQYDCAGWWYGYAATGGNWSASNPGGDWSPKNTDGTLMTTDPADGSVIPNGNLVEGANGGIKISLTSKAALDTENPGVAGLGFDFANPKAGENIASKGGYCLNYTLSGTGTLVAELGWNETTYGFDTYSFELTAGSAVQTAMPWAAFEKEGWGKGDQNQPVTTATSNAEALKFKLKNAGTSPVSVDFTIHGLGWLADCGGSASVKSSFAGSNLSANLSGRSLALSGLTKKPVTVQVISLQGQVVAQQNLSAASNTMSLSKLSSGVYAVKVISADMNMSKMINLQ